MRPGWLAAPVLVGLTCAVATAQEPHAAHDTPPQSGMPSAPLLYTQEDLQFLTHMVTHHQQAIEMVAMVPARSRRPELLKFARYLAGAQQAEIAQMQALVQAAADRGQHVPHHEMAGDPPMPGMLSKAQMTALEGSSGAVFERLWLQGMILHHQGAIDMALAQQRRDFEGRRQPYGISAMTDDVLTSQRAEIGMMKAWLAQWGLVDARQER